MIEVTQPVCIYLLKINYFAFKKDVHCSTIFSIFITHPEYKWVGTWADYQPLLLNINQGQQAILPGYQCTADIFLGFN